MYISQRSKKIVWGHWKANIKYKKKQKQKWQIISTEKHSLVTVRLNIELSKTNNNMKKQQEANFKLKERKAMKYEQLQNWSYTYLKNIAT